MTLIRHCEFWDPSSCLLGQTEWRTRNSSFRGKAWLLVWGFQRLSDGYVFMTLFTTPATSTLPFQSCECQFRVLVVAGNPELGLPQLIRCHRAGGNGKKCGPGWMQKNRLWGRSLVTCRIENSTIGLVLHAGTFLIASVTLPSNHLSFPKEIWNWNDYISSSIIAYFIAMDKYNYCDIS